MGSLTWKRFGAAFALGGRGQGGGFRTSGTQTLEGEEIRRARNEHCRCLMGRRSGDRSLWPQIRQAGELSRARQTAAVACDDAGHRSDFCESLRCVAMRNGSIPVQEAVQAGLSHKAHPGELPQNIYGALGNSTPIIVAGCAADAAVAGDGRSDQSVAKDSPLLRSLGNVWQTKAQTRPYRFHVNSEESRWQ